MKLDTSQQPVKAMVVDSTHLQLSQPLSAGKGQILYVAFFQPETEQDERWQWQAASQATLARAYDENEPDYSAAMVKESNVGYQP